MRHYALYLWVVVVASCRDATITPVAPPITACPEGAVLEGSAPPNGLKQVCQKSEGERHGASRDWYPDGRERSYSEWWNGQKHGRFTLWFKNGTVHSEGAHRHGVAAGHWKYFREDGTLQQDQTFPVEPPPVDWVAQAIAGHPPAEEPNTTPPSGNAGRDAPSSKTQ